MLSEIQKLVTVYYELISLDHHKSKDTYFSIETVIYPYEDVRFRAFHSGYISEIGELGYGPDRSTYDEALADMVHELKGFIVKELDFANRVLTESGWGDEETRQATLKINHLKNIGFEWLQLKGK